MRAANILASNQLKTFSVMGALVILALLVGLANDFKGLFGIGENVTAPVTENSQAPIQNFTLYVDGSIGMVGGDNKGTINLDTTAVTGSEKVESPEQAIIKAEPTIRAGSEGGEYPRAKVINHPLVSEDHSATLVEQERRIRAAQKTN